MLSHLSQTTHECVHFWSREKRWRSLHSIHHISKPHAACKLHGSIFYRIAVIAGWSFTLRKSGISRFLLLRPWPWPWPD